MLESHPLVLLGSDYLFPNLIKAYIFKRYLAFWSLTFNSKDLKKSSISLSYFFQSALFWVVFDLTIFFYLLFCSFSLFAFINFYKKLEYFLLILFRAFWDCVGFRIFLLFLIFLLLFYFWTTLSCYLGSIFLDYSTYFTSSSIPFYSREISC